MKLEPSEPLEKKHVMPSVGLHFPELPPDLVVAIEGQVDAVLRMTGEFVAKGLRAVLIDSGRYYGCLLLSCMEAGVAVEDPVAVAKYCAQTTVDISVKNHNGLCDEALVFVNGDFFSDDELESVRHLVQTPSLMTVTRDVVRWALNHVPKNRRAVVLGRDIGTRVLKATPFKFVLRSKDDALPSVQTAVPDLWPYYVTPRHASVQQTSVAVEMDMNMLSPPEACDAILSKLVVQNSQQEKRTKRSRH